MREEWYELLLSISENKTGLCPNCSSSDVQATFHPIRNNNGYIVIWCNSCKHGVHISRAKNNGTLTENNAIPDDLILQ